MKKPMVNLFYCEVCDDTFLGPSGFLRHECIAPSPIEVTTAFEDLRLNDRLLLPIARISVEGLTKKQRTTLEYLVAHMAIYGFTPTMKDIGKKFGLTSLASISDRLRYVKAKGYITSISTARIYKFNPELVQICNP